MHTTLCRNDQGVSHIGADADAVTGNAADSCRQGVLDLEVRSCGETLAKADDWSWDTIVDRIFRSWLDSTRHRAEFLRDSHSYAGFGWAVCADGEIAWTGFFADIG